MSYRHTRCETHWQEYKDGKYANKTLKEFRTKSSVKDKHPSWKNAHIRLHGRQQHKALLKLPCNNCGYSKHVELCHIKPVASFSDEALLKEVNDITNVVQLCRNCHWELDHPQS